MAGWDDDDHDDDDDDDDDFKFKIFRKSVIVLLCPVHISILSRCFKAAGNHKSACWPGPQWPPTEEGILCLQWTGNKNER